MTNVKFLNPFVEAAIEVLDKECNLQANRAGITLQKTALTANEITVMVSLIGQVQGVVLYSLAIKTGLGLVSRVLLQKITAFDNLAQSGIAELGNVITGRATVKLSQAGFSANISPPTLIIGKDTEISTLDFSRIVVPLETEDGEITVHLALRESPPNKRDSNFVPLSLPAKNR